MEKPKRQITKGTEFYYTDEWRQLKRATLERDRYICQYCGGRATSADHIVRRRSGGKDELSNLKAVCQYCNEFFGGNCYSSFESKRNHYLNSHDLDGKLIVEESDWDYNTDPTDTTNIPF